VQGRGDKRGLSEIEALRDLRLEVLRHSSGLDLGALEPWVCSGLSRREWA
jgi:hypothetical protein